MMGEDGHADRGLDRHTDGTELFPGDGERRLHICFLPGYQKQHVLILTTRGEKQRKDKKET